MMHIELVNFLIVFLAYDHYGRYLIISDYKYFFIILVVQ